MSVRASDFSKNVERHIFVSLAGRFKNCLRAGKFSKRFSLVTIVPSTFCDGSIKWSSVMLQRILYAPLAIVRRETAAIEAKASPRKPSVERFRRSLSVLILLVA